jgi:hypothetical protein
MARVALARARRTARTISADWARSVRQTDALHSHPGRRAVVDRSKVRKMPRSPLCLATCRKSCTTISPSDVGGWRLHSTNQRRGAVAPQRLLFLLLRVSKRNGHAPTADAISRPTPNWRAAMLVSRSCSIPCFCRARIAQQCRRGEHQAIRAAVQRPTKHFPSRVPRRDVLFLAWIT